MDETLRITDSATLAPGTLLKGGDYRIISTLGRGGFGVTYLAEQTGMHRKVCIKEFFPKDYYRRDGATNGVVLEADSFRPMMARFKEKFLKEARTIARFKHPNIVTIYDIFEENDTAYYVMEYVEGRSLKAIVGAEGALSESDAVCYIRQVASALTYIHEQNTVHLDVKPDNIMIADDSSAMLIDFGLAKHYDGGGEQTSTTPIGISRGYAPMEQYQTSGVSIFRPATDVYSLGATLFTLVTGAVPPEASVVNEEGLPALPAELSEGVRTAVEQAMQGRIKDRPQSVAAFVALLDQDSKGVAVKEKTYPRTPRYPAKPKKRSKWWLWLLLLLIIGGGVFAYLQTAPKGDIPGDEGAGGQDSSAVVGQDTVEVVEPADSTLLGGITDVEDPEPEPVPAPVLTPPSNRTMPTISHSGGSGSFDFSLENPVSGVNISVSDNANWLTTSVSGSTISYTASANESQSSRTATITVRYGDQSFEVVITQNGKPAPQPAPAPVLRLTSNSRVTVEHGGGNGTIRYSLENPASGVNLRVSDDASWLTMIRPGNTISYSASANESQSSRTATITVSYGDQSFEVVITQNGKPATTYAVGDYYNVNGVEGVVFEISDGGRHGKIVSVDQAEGELGWGLYRVDAPADSDTNGKANTDAIMALANRDSYPAFTWCRGKGSNWYLPAKNELLTISRYRTTINATLRARGYTRISYSYYWSSTEYNEYSAWVVFMNDGDTNYYFKGNLTYVRAVSAF